MREITINLQRTPPPSLGEVLELEEIKKFTELEVPVEEWEERALKEDISPFLAFHVFYFSPEEEHENYTICRLREMAFNATIKTFDGIRQFTGLKDRLAAFLDIVYTEGHPIIIRITDGQTLLSTL